MRGRTFSTWVLNVGSCLLALELSDILCLVLVPFKRFSPQDAESHIVSCPLCLQTCHFVVSSIADFEKKKGKLTSHDDV